jgi:hypothetical protein
MRERATGGPALAAAALLVTAAACSGNGSDDGGAADAAASGTPADATAPVTTELPACADARHVVVLDISGTITATKEEVLEWLQDSTDEPLPRPQAAELAAAYRERGYEILYVTGLPGTNMIGDRTVPEAMNAWLTRNGFPIEGTALETSHTPDPATELTNDLMVLNSDGVNLAAGYTDHTDDVQSFQVAGVQEIYLLGEEGGGALSTTLPGGDLAAQLARVEALPPVCRP